MIERILKMKTSGYNGHEIMLSLYETSELKEMFNVAETAVKGWKMRNKLPERICRQILRDKKYIDVFDFDDFRNDIRNNRK